MMSPKTRPLLTAVAAVVLSLLPAASASAANEWPQFRGPGGQGIAQAKDLPVTWSETQNVVWKTPVTGKAWSSPVIWGDQIWMTNATPDNRVLSVVCVDKKDGKVIHDLKLFDVPTPQFHHAFNSGASPTPVIEEGRVYVTWGTPGTACLDTKTGKTIWERRDIVVNHFRGAGSSPILYGDLYINNYDGSDDQFIIALDKNTGKTVWQTKRSIDWQDTDPKTGKVQADGDMHKAFSSPRVGTWGGKEILISTGSRAAYAYEPKTGKELWRLENRGAHSTGATPVIGEKYVYFSLGNGKNELLAVDPTKSGVLSNSGDVAFRVGKNVPTRTSPLLHDGLIYMADESGMGTCVDANTGDVVWKERLNGKNYSASPLLADGKIYFLSEEGKSLVVAPGKEFKKLGEGELESGFMASPAVADNALFLRTKTHLYRIEKKK